MKRFFLLLFIFLAFPGLGEDQVLWPLDIGISQSSSFAEFRGFRFHAGIDLRTQRQTGFPVKAIADGFVSRIKVQFRGYGYALYIDHPELKKRVVYGHLQDFSGPVAEYTRKKLRKMGQRFGIDDSFGPEKFPVKKGQVVAVSGETGSGPPHLHFEVRNMADEPEAPAFLGYRPVDKIFPTYRHIYFEPYSFPCEINRSFMPFKLAVKKMGSRKAVLPKQVELFGKVGVKIGISDHNGEGNVFGVEKISLSINDKLVFFRHFNRYSYAQSLQCSLVYDYIKSNQKGTGFVVNMFKLPAETLPFSAEYKPWSGFISGDSNQAASKISLHMSDFGNNQVLLEGNLSFEDFSYDEIFPENSVDNYEFDQIKNTSYYFVAAGRRKTKNTAPFFRRGRIRCVDGTGKSELLPCLLRESSVEIAIPIHERWVNGVFIGKKSIMPEFALVNSRGRKVLFDKKNMVEVPAGSIDLPLFARFYVANKNPANGGNEKTGLLKPYSPVFRLEPEDLVFDKDVKVCLTPEKYQGKKQSLGIYVVNENGDYSHVGEKIQGESLVAETRTGGEWVVLEDNVPPTITYSGKGRDYHLGDVFKFRVRDVGEGIDYLSASATWGKDRAEVYSDPDKSEIYVVRTSKKKKSELEVKVRDYAGNVQIITIKP